jgi:hypothetical protein
MMTFFWGWWRKSNRWEVTAYIYYRCPKCGAPPQAFCTWWPRWIPRYAKLPWGALFHAHKERTVKAMLALNDDPDNAFREEYKDRLDNQKW